MLKKVRANGIHYLESNFPKETIPLATALLFGSSDFITQNTMDNYRELGIVHLLAISGSTYCDNCFHCIQLTPSNRSDKGKEYSYFIGLFAYLWNINWCVAICKSFGIHDNAFTYWKEMGERWSICLQ